jgi:hypothetical protein
MANKKLWLQNNTGADVSVSDLGVKVPANGTLDVYAYNPYLTKEQVAKSKEDGSLAKRLSSGVLSVTKGTKNPKPHTLDHVKTSSRAVEVVKSKSAVLVNTKEEDVLADEDLGDFADYGLGELGHENAKSVRTGDGVVVVQQKQDDPDPEESDATVELEVRTNISGQSVVAMAKQAESWSNPTGPIVEDVSSPDQPYIVVKPPEPEIQQATAIKDAEDRLKAMDKARVRKEGNTIVVDGKTAGGRNLKTVAELNKVANKQGVPVEDLPQDVVASADADAVIKDEARYDARVATKDESGAIVMKVKEVSEEPLPESKKAKPTKVTKTKDKPKAKKKTSKKTSKKK